MPLADRPETVRVLRLRSAVCTAVLLFGLPASADGASADPLTLDEALRIAFQRHPSVDLQRADVAARGIQRPVMQIWGYNDPTVSLDQAMQLYRILAEKERRARWQVFNESGHFSFREHPQRFNDVLKSFIQAP